MDVFVLQHVHTFDDGEEDVKMIGVYSTQQQVDQAIERMRLQPGFCGVPDSFCIDRYPVDKDHWSKGYVTLKSGQTDDVQ